MPMSSSKKLITIGYKYYMGAHLALCHTIHAVTRLKIGDKICWNAPRWSENDGGIRSNSTVYINLPNLFGGQEREGGVVGNMSVLLGGGGQQVNPYLAKYLKNADNMPAFRHVGSIVLEDMYVSANNPGIRPWMVEVFSQPSPDWYPATDLPGTDQSVNPAHIIRECVTNKIWGLGYSVNDLDDVSFRAAALSLFNEKFSIGLIWDTEGSIIDFVTTILSHVDGVLYVNPSNGLFTIRLFRDDYDRDSLVHFNESNIISLDNYDRVSVGELANQVILIWFDNVWDVQRSVTLHNMAVRELQGGVVSLSVTFPGIGNSALASRIATRELKKASSAYSRVTIKTGRAGAVLSIGDCFKLSWIEYGLIDVIYRVGRVVYDSLGHVTLEAIEDSYSAGTAIYAEPPDSLWQDPISEPAPAPRHRVTETPYYDIDSILGHSALMLGEVDTSAGFIAYHASSPSDDAYSYSLYDRALGGTYVQSVGGQFTPTALLLAKLKPEITSTVGINPEAGLNAVRLNSYALIDNEIVMVTALTTSSITITRGILDTVPTSHAMGAVVWFTEDPQAVDMTQWAEGVTVQAKALTQTGKGVLALEAAPVDSIKIKRRWYRPYAPGNVKLNGLRWPLTHIDGELEFTWSHRDRLTQISYFVSQAEGNFGPEAGVTYTARVYSETGVIKRTVTGITGTTWTYTAAMESADGPGSLFSITIAAVRDTIESYQVQQMLVFRLGIGYGYGYGKFYGGWTLAEGWGKQYGRAYGSFVY